MEGLSVWSALEGLAFRGSKIGVALWSLGSREAHGCGVCFWVPGVCVRGTGLWVSGSGADGSAVLGGSWAPLSCRLASSLGPGPGCGAVVVPGATAGPEGSAGGAWRGSLVRVAGVCCRVACEQGAVQLVCVRAR